MVDWYMSHLHWCIQSKTRLYAPVTALTQSSVNAQSQVRGKKVVLGML